MKNNNHFLLKRIFIVLIVIMMAYLGLPKQVRAAEVVETWDISATESDHVTATLYNDGKLEISGTGKMKDCSLLDGGAPWYDSRNNIKNVIINSGITSIGSHAFFYCKSLTNIIIPEGVTSIGSYAFSDCSSLTSIIIPSSVASIGYEPFCDCKNLEQIDVDINNKNYSSQEGVLYDKNKTTIIKCPSKTNLTNITIPKGVTSISAYAFANCSNLTSITIPEGVTSICDYTFRRCTNLTSVNIPEDVISIGNGAFYDCFYLTNIKIPENVTSIGDDAFFACFNITSITIPNTVTSIGEDAFLCCINLTSINVDNNNKNYSSQEGVLYNKNKTELICCPAGFQLTSLTIPNTVTCIVGDAFCVCENLTSVTIPESVTSIGDDAFEDCSEDLTIYGYKDSTAEEYAKANNIKFSYINENQSKTFNLTIDPAGGEMLLPKTSNSEAQTTTEVYNNLEFTYGTQRLFMKTAYRATTTDKSQAWLGTYSGKAINGNNLMIKDGYKFKEWKIISGEGQIIDEQVDDGENGTIHNYYFDGNCEGDVVIQAQWEALPTITVDPNGAEMTIKKNEKTTQPQIITFYPGNQEKRVFAKVGKISGAEKSQDKWFGFTRMNDLNVPYRKGYTFDGWKITSGSGQLSEEQDDEGRYTYYYDCSDHGNVTIQAQWIVDETNPTEVEITVKNNRSYVEINETKYIIAEKKTTVESILNDLETNSEEYKLVLKDKESKKLANTDYLQTNQIVCLDGLEKNLKMAIVVKGDLNSDGIVDLKDLVKLNNYRINKSKTEKQWTSAEKIAFKALKGTEITDFDISQVTFRDIASLNNYRISK